MAQKIVIYQVLPRLFGNDKTANKRNGSIEENGSGKLSAFTADVLKEIASMGFNHIWYTGLLEHATSTDYSRFGIGGSTPDIVKGKAGSPYAVRDYYDISPDLADDVPDRMMEFEELVGRTHAAGLKVIMDFIPNHVAREYFSDNKPDGHKDFGAGDDTGKPFDPDNNFYYLPGHDLELEWDTGYTESPAKVSGNDCFTNRPTANDWYEAVKLNYGIDYEDGKKRYFDPVPDTWHKMKDILTFWAAKEVDGFRCDMAEMVPVEFWHWVIPKVKKVNPALIFIAEIYKPELYRKYIRYGHFDYLYDKVGLYDTLRNAVTGKQSAKDITLAETEIKGIEGHMVNFLENHDEQRIASDFFAGDPFQAIPAMIVSATIGTNPVMVYAGQELGERGMDSEGFSRRDGRTTIFDYWCVASLHAWRNGGRYGDAGLSVPQKALRDFYIKLLKICNEEAAIREGRFHDLMYLNYHHAGFDPDRQYAFFRYTADSLVLIIANFGGERKVRINIDPQSLEEIGKDPSAYKKAHDLLTGERIGLPGDWTDTLEIELAAHSGRILKLSE